MKRKPPVNATPDPTVDSVLDDFWPMIVNARSLSGYLPPELIGVGSFVPGPFCQHSTPYACVVLKEPLTSSVRDEHNRVGAWVNENCLVRLWAVLESHGFTKPIRGTAAKANTVTLLRGLRQHYAHGTGQYDEMKRRHRALRRELLKVFPELGNTQGIPLDIDQVLKPIFNDCRQYVSDVLRADAAAVTAAAQQAHQTVCQKVD